ncbi:hypothetical protein GCM10027579_13770 [Calidifontibacter terrae]
MLEWAEREDAGHEYRAVLDSITNGDQLPPQWQHATASGAFLLATTEQLVDLTERLNTLVEEWSNEVRQDRDAHPDSDRRAVRVIARAFVTPDRA